jgi:hypothetical protein
MSYGPPFYFWEKNFHIAAMTDNYSVFREHLLRLEAEEVCDDPKLLLEGAIELVSACLAYAAMDHHIDQFLKMQRYDPAEARGAAYVLTFDLQGAATAARIFVDAELKNKIDLADIYGHPWMPYRMVGHSRVWITHLNWSQLSEEELALLPFLGRIGFCARPNFFPSRVGLEPRVSSDFVLELWARSDFVFELWSRSNDCFLSKGCLHSAQTVVPTGFSCPHL